jgi:hypothetical protein
MNPLFPIIILGIKQVEKRQGNQHEDVKIEGVAGHEKEDQAQDRHRFAQGEGDDGRLGQVVHRPGRQDFLDHPDDAVLSRGKGQEDIPENGGLGGSELQKPGEGGPAPLDEFHYSGIDKDRGDHGQADEVDGQVAGFQGYILMFQNFFPLTGINYS